MDKSLMASQTEKSAPTLLLKIIELKHDAIIITIFY